VTPSQGTQLGRYWLDREIASGGMARVHLGRLLGPVGFGRTVAIKRLHPHMVRDEQFVAMFVDEARLATRVQHPNVVPVLDVVTADGELFLVMEYVHGESLAQLLRLAKSPPSPAIAAAIMIGVLEGLDAVHEARGERGEPLAIVHRDVSPQNVLVGIDGTPRVTDFGVAKAESRLVTTGDGSALKGKLPYMAPEQLSTSDVDRRADIWAAAVILWELVAGARLFKASSEPLLMRAVLEKEILPPTQGQLPLLDEVVMKGLSREAGERYATAREMAVALDRVIAPASAREVGEWVEKVASTALKERRAVVEDMESATPVGGVSVRSQLAALRASESLDEHVAAMTAQLRAARGGDLSSDASDALMTQTTPMPTRVEGTGGHRAKPPARSRLSAIMMGFVGIGLVACGVILATIPRWRAGRGPVTPAPTAYPSVATPAVSSAAIAPSTSLAPAAGAVTDQATSPPQATSAASSAGHVGSSASGARSHRPAWPAPPRRPTSEPATPPAPPVVSAAPVAPPVAAPVDSVRLDRRH